MQSWYARRLTCTLLPDEAHHTGVLDLLRAAGSAGANLVTDDALRDVSGNAAFNGVPVTVAPA